MACQSTGVRRKELGLRVLIGSVGNAYDTAMAESFFARLECELIDQRSCTSFAKSRQAIFTWLEGWYKPKRPVDLHQVEAGEHGVVPLGQRSAARDDRPRRVIADGFELPHATDPLQVADVVTRRIQHPAGAVVDPADRT